MRVAVGEHVVEEDQEKHLGVFDRGGGAEAAHEGGPFFVAGVVFVVFTVGFGRPSRQLAEIFLKDGLAAVSVESLREVGESPTVFTGKGAWPTSG